MGAWVAIASGNRDSHGCAALPATEDSENTRPDSPEKVELAHDIADTAGKLASRAADELEAASWVIETAHKKEAEEDRRADEREAAEWTTAAGLTTNVDMDADALRLADERDAAEWAALQHLQKSW